MEPLDFSNIIKKLGEEKDFSLLTEEELSYYDSVKAIRNRAASIERKIIKHSILAPEIHLKPEVHKHETNKPILLKFLNKTLIRIAAGIAIIIIAYFFLLKQNIATDQIYVKYFKQESDYLYKAKENLAQYGMIDSRVESRDSLSKGLEFYEKMKYDDAIRILSDYIVHYPSENTARFYLALSQMSSNEFELAINHLAVLNETKNLEFSEEVKWYYILCLLKSENNANHTKSILEQLKRVTGKYERQAKEIIQTL